MSPVSTVARQTATSPTSVLVVDDHPIVRAGVAAILAGEPWVERVGQAGSAEEAFASLRQRGADLVVLDVHLPGMDGFSACARMAGAHPGVRVLMLTRLGHERAAQQALDAGASGFLVKDSDPEQLRRAARAVAKGEHFVDPRVRATPGCHPGGERPGGLTPRELAVVELVSRGFSGPKMAAELGVSAETVKTHLRGAMRKLGVRDRASLAATAVRRGLLAAG